ncbi:SCO family protein [Magnetospira thiophila]
MFAKFSMTVILASLFLLPSLSRAEIGGRYVMQNHFGEVVYDKDFQGKFQLITFGYTFCPDICPTQLQTMADSLDQLSENKRERIIPLFVTLDPQRDTLPVLRAYVATFHPQIIGLTGTPELVKRMAQLFKVKYDRVESQSGDPEMYTLDHTSGAFLMDPDGKYVAKIPHASTVEQMVQTLNEIISEK